MLHFWASDHLAQDLKHNRFQINVCLTNRSMSLGLPLSDKCAPVCLLAYLWSSLYEGPKDGLCIHCLVRPLLASRSYEPKNNKVAKVLIY